MTGDCADSIEDPGVDLLKLILVMVMILVMALTNVDNGDQC